MKLATLTQFQLNGWADQSQRLLQSGQLPDYIPFLSQVDRTQFVVWIESQTGSTWSIGDSERTFPLMSVIKPFVLLFLLKYLGAEAVFQRVGMVPSDQSFNSLLQLELDQGWPRNPMINSGAMVLAALLPGHRPADRCEALRQWLNQSSGANLYLDAAVLNSVNRSGNQRNQTLIQLLSQSGRIDHFEQVLETYNQICCLSGTIVDLAKLGLLLACPPAFLPVEHCQIVNALMLTCGLYEQSGVFAVRIGLPMKSGVSGALIAIVPGEGCIACYGPALDSAGNSLAGTHLLEQLSRHLKLSIFS